MKPHSLLAIMLCLLFCGEAFAQTQDMDKELAALTEKLGAKIKAAGKKKITVLDFADLDGNTTDLGKYVAEQLTVEFVSGDQGFTVVDRANLKKILEEHKLTASGLVNPENAKKLGSFSGVDALILGTIVPMTPNIKLTAKIIATDTADIVGAGQCTFKADENVQGLLTRKAPESHPEQKTADGKPAAAKIMNQFGELSVTYESQIRMSDSTVLVNLIFANTSADKTIAVAMHGGSSSRRSLRVNSSLVGADGTKWSLTTSDLTGITSGHEDPGDLTVIEAHKELKAALSFFSGDMSSKSSTQFRLQAELVLNRDYDENQYNNYRVGDTLPPKCKIVNLVMDLPANAKGK
jgi:hypothetical protein